MYFLHPSKLTNYLLGGGAKPPGGNPGGGPWPPNPAGGGKPPANPGGGAALSISFRREGWKGYSYLLDQKQVRLGSHLGSRLEGHQYRQQDPNYH